MGWLKRFIMKLDDNGGFAKGGRMSWLNPSYRLELPAKPLNKTNRKG